MTPRGWKRVVFSADCDEDGNCPVCHMDFADCDCPGPTQEDEYDYTEIDGVLMARRLDDDEYAQLGTLITRRVIPADENDDE